MRITLEDAVPYDRSARWRLHDAYFAQRGAETWTEIPSRATSNYALARQHAELFVELCAQLERAGALAADEPIGVLEAGCGSGELAANFLLALEDGCGDRGAAIARRVRYVFSDYTELRVREAAARRVLAERVATGHAIPALLDLRRPDGMVGLDGQPIALRFALVLANYVCAALPLKLLRKTSAGFDEGYCRLEVDLELDAADADREPRALLDELFEQPFDPDLMKHLEPIHEWRAVELDAVLPDPMHARVIRRTLATLPTATLRYPWVFLEFVRAIQARVVSGAVALVNDFGSVEAADLASPVGFDALYYGNTISHPINFAVFDAFCAELGLDCVRTQSTLRPVHVMAIRYAAEHADDFAASFHAIEVARTDGEDLVDFATAAHLCATAEPRDPDGAVRFLERCLRLDPRSTRLLYELGEACIDGNRDRLALEYLERGLARDVDREHDFEFQLGRLYFRAADLARSAACYERSLERDDHPVTLTNLGFVYLALGDRDRARAVVARALEHDDTDARANELAAKL